ncbi:hypothetical protein D3C78_1263640 [compost metagenome]
MQKAIRTELQGRHGYGHFDILNATPDQLLNNAPTKISRVLAYLRHFGSLNRFEAALLVGDSCLNSTIPVLEHRYGQVFMHVSEKSPNNWGSPCDVTRYSLPVSEHEKADAALALMFCRAKRTATKD